MSTSGYGPSEDRPHEESPGADGQGGDRGYGASAADEGQVADHAASDGPPSVPEYGPVQGEYQAYGQSEWEGEGAYSQGQGQGPGPGYPQGQGYAHGYPQGQGYAQGQQGYQQQAGYPQGPPDYVPPQQSGQPPYAGQPYSAYGYPPYGEDPMAKSRLAAGLLGIFLGGLGIHRFYLGYVGIGILQIFVTLITFGLGHIWGLIEGILYLTDRTGSYSVDATGRPLRS